MSQFASLVDRTCFEIVRRTVNQPGSPVTDILFVDGDLLVRMAELLTTPTSKAGKRQLLRWFEDGRVTIGTTAFVQDGTTAAGACVDLLSIDRRAACDVLYLPPYYLVHLAGGRAGSSETETI